MRALALAAAIAFLSGCSGGGDDRALREWTFVRADGITKPLTLPAHVDGMLPRAAGSYTLRTTLAIPAEWRGRPLTIAFPFFRGKSVLRIGELEVGDAYASAVDRVTSTGSQLFRIPSAVTDRATLDVELRVQHVASFTGWIDTVPLLSPNPDGASRAAFVRIFNAAQWATGVAIVSFVALTYGALFLMYRTRRAFAWFALQCATILPYLAYFSGWSQLLLGARDLWPWHALPMEMSMVAGAHFAAERFDVAPLRGLTLVGLVGMGAAAILLGDPFRTVPWILAYTTILAATAAIAVIILVRVLRARERTFDAALYLVCWLGGWSIAAPSVASWMGLGQPLGGVQTQGLALTFFAVLQFLGLAREHVASLRESEARVKELSAVAQELRHQVAARSRELASALSRDTSESGTDSLSAGDRFDDRYVIVRSIGRGGMGRVYEVERVTDGGRFALKVATGVVSGASAARFAREVEIGARMRHPNLVAIVDVGVVRGTPFLVMELVSGGSLDDERQRFGEIAWGLPILTQIARALEALHAEGVVHRDLKPANVLLTQSDGGITAKVADFGISRFDDSRPHARGVDPELFKSSLGRARDKNAPKVTTTGSFVGTPEYMPPEATTAPAVEPSADVYAFGILTWEVLTGSSPYAVPALYLALAGQTIPDPIPLGEEVPRELARLLRRCVGVDPRRRPSMTDLAETLERASRD